MRPSGSATPRTGDAVFQDQYGSRRDGSPDTGNAWEQYYREQAGRQSGGSTPRAAAPIAPAAETAAWEAYYRNRGTATRAEQQFNAGAATPSTSRPEEGEIVARRPAPRPVPIYRTLRGSRPVPIFRGLRYYIHKTVSPNMFGWLRSLLVWNGAELGCYRPDTADIVILHFPTPQPNKRVEDVEPERTIDECRARNVWETSDLYALLARRTSPHKDKDKLARRCIVQAEWVEQSVKGGKRLEDGDKGGWEIKVINDRLAQSNASATANVSIDMPGSIITEPAGSIPTLSFDFDPSAGTIEGGPAPGEDAWVYQPPDDNLTGSSIIDSNNIYALPPRDATPALAASSNANGVFCRDQGVPLTFHVLKGDGRQAVLDIITRDGGGVLAPLQQATFIITPARGRRLVHEADDHEVYRIIAAVDPGRSVISVEWVERCIADDTLSSIDPYRVNIYDPDMPIIISRPTSASSSRGMSPPPPKPDIRDLPVAPPRHRAIRKPRRTVVEPARAALTASDNRGSTAFMPAAAHVPMLPTPRASPISDRATSPDITPVPNAVPPRKRLGPAARQQEVPVIDLTLSDEEEDELEDDEKEEELGAVEQILPTTAATPAPRSPSVRPRASLAPSAASRAGSIPASALSAARAIRNPTPSLFQLSPGANKRKR